MRARTIVWTYRPPRARQKGRMKQNTCSGDVLTNIHKAMSPKHLNHNAQQAIRPQSSGGAGQICTHNMSLQSTAASTKNEVARRSRSTHNEVQTLIRHLHSLPPIVAPSSTNSATSQSQLAEMPHLFPIMLWSWQDVSVPQAVSTRALLCSARQPSIA